MVSTLQHRQALHMARSGRVSEAEVIFRRLLTTDPSDAEALHFFGVLAANKGDAVEAERIFRQALETQPGWAKAWNSLGGTLHAQRRFEEAVRALAEAVRLDSAYVEWRFNLGVAFRAAGRLAEAAEALRVVTETAPGYAEGFCGLAAVLKDMSLYAESEAACRRAIEIEPRLAEAHNILGIVLRQLRRTEAAEAAYRHAIDINPKIGQVHGNLANMLWAQGRFTEAEAEYRQSVILEPAHTEPYRMLADLKSIKVDDPLFLLMSDLLESDTIQPAEKIDLHFAVAAVLEDDNDHDGAFNHWQAGNELKKSLLHWEDSGREDHVRRVMAVFDEDLLTRHLGGGSPSRAPIFVLGMPRSGTTLVEQILASHSRVDGGGELAALPRLAGEIGYPENCARLDSAALRGLGERYLTEARPGNGSHFTDKMPDNYVRIGFIRLIFPNAHIIHCRRDPVDTCLSCYRTLFSGDSQGFSYDLTSLGREYRRYRGVMEHWSALMPDAIHEVCYEDLIADKDREIRRLLDFCGLDFEDNCLRFHETDRPVETASASQVRQAIFRTSVRRWKKYEKHLKPLLDVIDVGRPRLSDG